MKTLKDTIVIDKYEEYYYLDAIFILLNRMEWEKSRELLIELNNESLLEFYTAKNPWAKKDLDKMGKELVKKIILERLNQGTV